MTEAEKFPRWAWAVVAMLATAYAFWFGPFAIDDAMIALCHARTLAETGMPGIFPGASPYTFTSILQVALLAVAGKLVAFDHAIGTVTAAELVALAAGAVRLASALGYRHRTGLLLAITLALNPLIASTFGLESLLAVTLLIWAFAWFREERWAALGGSLGALVLARPDLVVIAIAVLAMAWRRGGARRALLPFLVPVTLWHAFAWWRLGTALPSTFFLKRSEASWGPWDFGRGLRVYFYEFPLATSVAVFPALTALAAWRLPFARRVAGLALLHFAVFATLGVPPYHWYYVPAIGLGIVAGWIALAPRPLFCALGTAVVVVGFLVAGMPRGGEVPIHTNWATPEQYRAFAQNLTSLLPPGTEVDLSGEIGALAYYSRLPLWNSFTDPHWLEQFSGPNFLFRREAPPRTPAPYALRGSCPGGEPDEGVLVREFATHSRAKTVCRWHLVRNK